MIFEIHCTCEKENFNPDEFKKDCATIGVKAVQVVLDGLNCTHSMTSATIDVPHSSDALLIAKKTAEDMNQLGYNVQRIKIETTPDFHLVPKEISDVFPRGCYFESHIKVQVQNGYYETLKNALSKSQWHLSSNSYKKNSDEHIIFMITYRKHSGTHSEFVSEVDAFIESHNHSIGYKINPKYITEFAIYDSNIHMDDEWLRK